VEEIAGGREVINQPAGHVEPGESFPDAVVREVQEETAWKFEPEAISGVYLWEHPESGEQFLRITFSGKCRDHDPVQPLDDGIIRNLWLTRDELEKRAEALRSPMVLHAIDDYQDRVRYPVNMFQQLDFEALASQATKIV